MTKKLLITLVSAMLVLMPCQGALADDQLVFKRLDAAVPYYQNVDDAYIHLSLSKGVANVKAEVRNNGKAKTSITGTVYLQKLSEKKWSEVTSWTQRSNTGALVISKKKKVGKGRYRAKAVFKITKGKKTETITKYSKIVAY